MNDEEVTKEQEVKSSCQLRFELFEESYRSSKSYRYHSERFSQNYQLYLCK